MLGLYIFHYYHKLRVDTIPQVYYSLKELCHRIEFNPPGTGSLWNPVLGMRVLIR